MDNLRSFADLDLVRHALNSKRETSCFLSSEFHFGSVLGTETVLETYFGSGYISRSSFFRPSRVNFATSSCLRYLWSSPSLSTMSAALLRPTIIDVGIEDG